MTNPADAVTPTWTLRLLFGPEAISMQTAENGGPRPLTTASLEDVADTEHIIVVVHTSTPHLSLLRHLNLSHFPAMRSLAIDVVFDTIRSGRIVDAWTAILAALRSVPEATPLARVTLTSPVPLAILHAGWSRSAVVEELRLPLYSVDRLLVGLVDHSPMLRVVTLVVPEGETFLSTDWTRARSFFAALWDYGMLQFGAGSLID